MGNMLLRGGIDGRRRIKIMKADGTMMKLRSPVSVKEILIDYPNHGIFEAPAGPRALPERAQLVVGHLYYLIALPLTRDELLIYNNNSNSNSNSNRRPFAKASSCSVPISTSCRLQPPSYAVTATDSVKQQEEVDPVVNKINKGSVGVVSSSYCTAGSTVRVKLRVRKEELASFLSANNLIMENLVVPTIIQRTSRQSALRLWKPSLDTIAEPHSPLADS